MKGCRLHIHRNSEIHSIEIQKGNVGPMAVDILVTISIEVRKEIGFLITTDSLEGRRSKY